MCRVIAPGSFTATRFALTFPLVSRLITVVRNCLRSAKWFGADTRVSGSLETVLRYQLKSGFPSSPRAFLGWGDWFMSTLTGGPTMRTDRPRYGGGGESVLVWLCVAPLFPFSGLVAFSSVKAMAISPFLRYTVEKASSAGSFTGRKWGLFQHHHSMSVS